VVPSLSFLLYNVVAQLVETLRYKPEGCGFDSRWCHWNILLIYSFRRHTMALKLTQPLTGMSSRNISWGVRRPVCRADQPYHLHVPNVLKSGSLNLLEHSGPVQACNGIALPLPHGRLRFKCDGTHAETRIRLSAKRTSPFLSAEIVSSVDCWQPRCVHQR